MLLFYCSKINGPHQAGFGLPATIKASHKTPGEQGYNSLPTSTTTSVNQALTLVIWFIILFFYLILQFQETILTLPEINTQCIFLYQLGSWNTVRIGKPLIMRLEGNLKLCARYNTEITFT